jgi:streptogramin lyase
VEYTGRNGNPTNGGNLGSIDKAGHVRMYQIPGAGASLAIAAGKDGTIWLGDYYSEQIIKVDPSKL